VYFFIAKPIKQLSQPLHGTKEAVMTWNKWLDQLEGVEILGEEH
jgi:hypothetical protein